MSINLSNSEIIVIVSSLLTVLVTVIGWSATLTNQKKLINEQFEADKKKYISELVIKNNLNNLEEITNWREEGQQILYSLDHTSKSESNKRYQLWRTNYFSYICNKAKQIDFRIEEVNNKGLGFWLFREFFYASCKIEMGLGMENRSGIMDEIEFMNKQIQISSEVEYRLNRIKAIILDTDIPSYGDVAFYQLKKISEDEVEEILADN